MIIFTDSIKIWKKSFPPFSTQHLLPIKTRFRRQPALKMTYEPQFYSIMNFVLEIFFYIFKYIFSNLFPPLIHSWKTHTHANTRTYTHAHAHTHTYMHTCTTHVHARTYTHAHARTYKHACAWTSTCTSYYKSLTRSSWNAGIRLGWKFSPKKKRKRKKENVIIRQKQLLAKIDIVFMGDRLSCWWGRCFAIGSDVVVVKYDHD